MDPERVRSYLQVACAGLGFDIGEIWWSQSKDGDQSSALMAIEEKAEADGGSTEVVVAGEKKLRFVQLYTSKSYEDRRNMLVKPADEEENYNNLVNRHDDEAEEQQQQQQPVGDGTQKKDDDENSKHVLSPLLVDAITKTAQVVWAHTRKQEGLLGRSDIRLQTAVGMPVAVDGNGNMCVVVMFSPNNIQSTDDAMDYLQSISRSATSTSIPSLLPAFDPSQGLVSLPHHHPSNENLPLLSAKCISDGVITRFVSLDDAPISATNFEDTPEVYGNHELASAPKDCFGIPMLPHVSEFGGSNSNLELAASGADAFDEASYGVWSTVMDTVHHPSVSALADGELDEAAALLMNVSGDESAAAATSLPEPIEEDTKPVYAINKPVMERERRIRLEEFASAFLDVSVFDLAEVWIPIGAQSDYLGQVTAISSSENNVSINEFKSQSEKLLIKFWSGAAGRAFSSGNPVWSTNSEVFVDSGRSRLFATTKLQTALAVPVFSGGSSIPSFVFCCYSFVRTGSVPFVLKFVQQALRLLWGGLDKVQPHKSLGEDMWNDVAPADLGEMAADVEMQQHFIIKKRPHHAISPVKHTRQIASDSVDESLALQIGALEKPSGTNEVRSIYTGSSPVTGPTEVDPNLQPNPFITYETIQKHVQDAVRSVGVAQPIHHHISTNEQGTKRAHVYAPVEVSQHGPSPYTTTAPSQATNTGNASPLPMPRPLPLPTQVLGKPSSRRASGSSSTQHMHAPNNWSNQNIGQMEKIQAPASQPVYTDASNQYQGAGSQLQYSTTGGIQAQQQQEQQQQQQQQPRYAQHQNQQHTSQGVYTQQLPYEPTGETGRTSYLQQQQQQQQPPQHETGQVGYTQQATNYAQQQHQQQVQAQNAYVQQQPMQVPAQNMYPQPQQQIVQSPEDVYAQQQRQQSVQNGYEQSQHQQQQQQPVQSNFVQQQTAPRSGYSQQQAPPIIYTQQPPSQNGYSQSPQQTGQTIYTQQQNGYAQQQSQEQSQIVYPTQGNQPGRLQQGDENLHLPPPYAAQGGSNASSVPTTVASIPTHQLSATGITLPAGTHTAMASQPFCLPANQAPAPFPDVATNGKPCRIQGCSETCAPRRPYCVRHSGNRMCEHEGCTKCAQGSTRFCIAHGGGRRCTHPGCDKGARDKFFCAAHGGGKRCKAEGCNKSAEGGSNLCTAHGGGRRCSVEGCDKSAQSSTKFCVKHGGGKKCSHPDCEKVARGRTQFCAAHGGGVRCKLAGCNRVAIGKLQLCRAHGGGARPRGRKQASPSPPPAAVPQLDEMFNPNNMGGFGMESTL